MYVRDAKNREEVWLLDRLDQLGIEDPAFRSRDYVISIDETSGEKAGFGRIRIHPGDPEVCELAAVGVLPEWRDQGVGAHVIERLIAHAGDAGFDELYVVTDQIDYCTQFGFEPVSTDALSDPLAERLTEVRKNVSADAIVLTIEIDDFEMPDRLRERFKAAGRKDIEPEPVDTSEADSLREEFGIDPEAATYKYDTGR